jgi:hypothetical protein
MPNITEPLAREAESAPSDAGRETVANAKRGVLRARRAPRPTFRADVEPCFPRRLLGSRLALSIDRGVLSSVSGSRICHEADDPAVAVADLCGLLAPGFANMLILRASLHEIGGHTVRLALDIPAG